jgi:hypothetical protein
MPNGNRFAGPEWVTAQTFELLAKGGIRKGTCECELPLRESPRAKAGSCLSKHSFCWSPQSTVSELRFRQTSYESDGDTDGESLPPFGGRYGGAPAGR